MINLSIGMQIVIGFAFVISIPFISYPVVLRVLDEENNAMTFLGLTGYTVLDGGFAWLLMGFAQPGFWQALILIAVVVLAAAYNYLVFVMMNRYGG